MMVRTSGPEVMDQGASPNGKQPRIRILEPWAAKRVPLVPEGF